MNISDIYQTIVTILSDQDLISKFILIILISLYTLFAIVIMVQIRVLNRIINQIHFSEIFKFLALLHTGISLILLLFTIFAL